MHPPEKGHCVSIHDSRATQRGRTDWLLAHCRGRCLECLERCPGVVDIVVSVLPHMVQVPLDETNEGLKHDRMKQR